MTLRLSFLAIGSELLSGHVLESNSHWLQKQLKDTSVECVLSMTVLDRKDSILKALALLSKESDLVIVCGGLGPTDDDITREILAEFNREELVFDDIAWGQVKSFFAKKNKPIYESNRKQAMRPASSKNLENVLGSAPALSMLIDKIEYFAFPGVPREFKYCAETYVLPKFKKEASPIQFKLFGIGESQLMDRVKEEAIFPEQFEWGTIAALDGITVKFSSDSERDVRFSEVISKFESVFERYIYTKSNLDPVGVLGQELSNKKMMIATAESCTGGLLMAKLTEIPGSSAYAKGTTVAYQNEIKRNELKVSQKILDEQGAVSEACAISLARGVMQQMNSDLGIGITGIAGPGGGTKDKPVGTVWIASVCSNGREKVECFLFTGTRSDIRERSCYSACIQALSLLK